MADKKEKKKVITGVTRSDYFKLLKKVSRPIKSNKEKKLGKVKGRT